MNEPKKGEPSSNDSCGGPGLLSGLWDAGTTHSWSDPGSEERPGVCDHLHPWLEISGGSTPHERLAAGLQLSLDLENF